MEDMKKFELNDEELDTVVGGYDVGATVHLRGTDGPYCQCGKMLSGYGVTITGVRGVQDGNTVYWITYNCCGRRSSVIETEIVG